MAKVIGPCLSIEARNQLGRSMIFSTRKGANIVRAFNVPKKVKTHAQELQRARYKNYREEWRYMTTARKTIFNARAIEQNRISGYHQFLHENLDISRKGQLYLDLSCQALWHLNEESADVAYDGTRNHYDCSISNVIRTPGKFAGALKFDGISGDVTVASEINTPSWTVNMWLKSTGPSGIDFQNHFLHVRGIDASYYRFYVRGDQNKIALRWKRADGRYTTYYPASNFPLNEWVFLSITYDNLTTTLKGYVNGLLNTTIKIVTGMWSNFGGEIYIGRNKLVADQRFNGVIDEVAIYNCAKTPEEIKSSYDLA